MKRFSKFAASLLAFVMLFGVCASAGAAEGTIVSADYYSVYTSEIGTLNYLITNKTVDADAIAAFLDPLILVDNYGALQPGMATSWEQSEDGLKWTFKIREGIKWQKDDGSEYGPDVTAQDWVDAIEYILDPDLASETVDFVLGFIEGAEAVYNGEGEFSEVGVKAIDEYTLEYTTTGVYPFFPSLMTYSCFLPVNKQFVEEIGGISEFGTEKDKILYYGEYLFETWARDQEWTFVKNDSYYLADRVHVQKRNYVQVQDGKVQLEMYKRGEVTAAPIVADQVDGIFEDPELSQYVYRTSLTAASWYYYYNFASPNENFVNAASNLNFRKAIMSAFDRTTILSATNKYDPDYLKRNTLNVWGLSVDENGNDYMTYGDLPEIEATDFYDMEASKEYMAKAKEELGDTVTWPLTMVLSVQATDTSLIIAAVIKQSIEQALEGDITVEFATYTADQYYQVQDEGNYDFTSGGWSPDYADPASYLEINMVEGFIGQRAGFGKLAEWVTFDEMMKEAKSKTVLSERFEALANAESYMIENALVIPYRGNGGNYAINNIQNPYASTSLVPYGLCNSKWLDVYYGDKPLTIEEREAQKAEFEASKNK